MKFEESKNSGVHFILNRMQGTWKGNTITWFEPDVVADESPIEGTMKLILDGKFILHEYRSSIQTTPLEGVAIIGFDLNLNKFQIAWADSLHNETAIMFSEGKRGDENFSMLGGYTYITPESEQYWGWRTEINLLNDDELLITSFNISPDGEEARATEVSYQRVGRKEE